MGKSAKSKMSVTDYRATLHFGVCLGPVDYFRAVRVNEKDVWRGVVSTNTTVQVNDPSLFGGMQKEGGVEGVLHFLMGAANQLLSPALANRLGKNPDKCVAYRGISSVYFTGSTMGQGFMFSQNSPIIASTVDFEVTTAPKGLNPALAFIVNPDFPAPDCNPANIIFDAYTDPYDGIMGVDDMDYAAYNNVAQTLFDEGFGLSLGWVKSMPVEAFVSEIQDHINAVTYIDPETGLSTIKLIRDDYDVATLFEINEDNATLIDFQRKMWGETVNQIDLSWTNPITEKEENITVQDLGSIQFQGPIPDGRNHYGIRHRGLAETVAQRDLRSASTPVASVSVDGDRSMWKLRPGQAVRVYFPNDNPDKHIDIICRVGEIEYGEPGADSIPVSLMEDVFSLARAPSRRQPTTEWVDPSVPPTPMAAQAAFTLPHYLLTSADYQDRVTTLEYPEAMVGVLGYHQSYDALDFELVDQEVQATGEVVYATAGVKTITERGLLMQSLPVEDSSQVLWSVNHVNRAPRVGGFAIIGDGPENTQEWVLIREYDGYQYGIDRGVLDTIPRAWPQGTPVWYINPGSRIIDDKTVRSAGEEVDYALLTRTSRGNLTLGTSPTLQMTVTDRPHRPLRPASVRINGQPYGTVSVSGSSEMAITWATRNRLLEDGQVVPWYAGPVAPEYRQRTIVEVSDTAGNLIRRYVHLWTQNAYTIPKDWFARWAEVRIDVYAYRDDLGSLQHQTFRITDLANNPNAAEPPAAPDEGVPPPPVAAPAEGRFTATGGAMPNAGGTGSAPAIFVRGRREGPEYLGLVVRYAVVSAGAPDWKYHPAATLDERPLELPISGVAAQTKYNVECAYVSENGTVGFFRALGEVTSGLSVSDSSNSLAFRPASQILGEIDDLIETYGDTVASGANAAAAEAAAAAADLARLAGQAAQANSELAAQLSDGARALAVTARNAAQGAAGLADSARVDAQAANTAAVGARDAAIQKAQEAAGSAGTASGFASVATSAADTATGQASAASGSALIAQSARDDSEDFASASSTSASAAASSANASGQSASASDQHRIDAQTARSGAEIARNESVSARNDAAGSASSAGTQASLAATSAYNAQQAVISQGRLNLLSRYDWRAENSSTGGIVIDTPGNTGTWGARIQQAGGFTWAGFALNLNAATPYSLRAVAYADAPARVYVEFLNNGSIVAGGPGFVIANAAQGYTYIWDNFTLNSAVTSVRFIATDTTQGSFTYFFDPKIEQAATASNYTASPRDALGYASASLTSANYAASQASAAGSSATAAQNSRLAAEAADRASGQSAAASLTSASAAASSASAAGSSASVAESSRLAAETAKGGAESARDASAASAQTADGHRSAAQSSATNAAQSKTDAGISAGAAQTSAGSAQTFANNAESSAASAASSSISANASLLQQGRLNLLSRYDWRAENSTAAVEIVDTPTNTGTWGARVPQSGGYSYAGFAINIGVGDHMSLRFVVQANGPTSIYVEFVGPSGTVAGGPTLNVTVAGQGYTYGWDNAYNGAAVTSVRLIAYTPTASGREVYFLDPKIESGLAASAYTASPRDGLGYAMSGVQSAQTATAKANAAGQSASAADTSRTLAETARGQAAVSASNAATSESNALGSSNSASSASSVAATSRDQANAARDQAGTARDLANQYRGQAEGHASAASTSASTANTKADQAGQSASAANTAKTQAETARGLAETYRDEAASSRTAAGASEVAARSSAGLSARIGLGTLNNYPTFALYDDACQNAGQNTGLPNGWVPFGSCMDQYRVPGRFSDWAFYQHNNAGGIARTCGIAQDYSIAGGLKNVGTGYAVLEADIRLVAGQLGGAGVLFYLNAGGSSVNLDFANIPPVGRDTPLGYEFGTVGTYSFRKLVKIDNAGNGNGVFHLMTDWEVFDGNRRPKIIIWDRCDVRPATDMEVAAGRADANAAQALANIATEASTRATDVAAIAQRLSTTEARAAIRPNLFAGFEGGVPPGTTAGGTLFTASTVWGNELRIAGAPNGTNAVSFPPIGCPEGAFLTITGDSLMFAANAGYCYFDLVALKSDGGVAGESDQGYVYGQHDYSDDSSRRSSHAQTWQTPPGTVKVIPRFVYDGTGITAVGCRNIKVEYGGGWTAYTADKAQQTLGARTSIVETSVADAQSKLAIARLTLIAEATGGRPARMGLYSDTYGTSAIQLDAKSIYFGDNTVFDDPSDTLQTVWGTTRRCIAWGAPFGPDSLTEWEGPSNVALSAMSKANARFWRNSVAPYMGGQAFSQAEQLSYTQSAYGSTRTVSGAGTYTTPNVTVQGVGGSGTYSYNWFDVSSQSDQRATTNMHSNGGYVSNYGVVSFTGTVVLGESLTATAMCLITDTGTGKTVTAFVYGNITENA